MFYQTQRYAQVLTILAAARTIGFYLAATAIALAILAGKAARFSYPYVRYAAIQAYNAGRRFKRYVDTVEAQLNEAVFTPEASTVEVVFWQSFVKAFVE